MYIVFFSKGHLKFIGLHFFQDIFHTVVFQFFCVLKAFTLDLISKYELDLECVLGNLTDQFFEKFPGPSAPTMVGPP